MDISSFGWDEFFENRFREFAEKNLLPARVIESNRLIYKIVSEKGEMNGKLSGKFRYSCISKEDYPTVGDWVAFKPCEHKGFVSIQGMLERRSKFSRKAAGNVSEEQVIAANIDTIFIVSGLDEDFSLRRLERYVTLAADSNAQLVFILNKADLCKNLAEAISSIKDLFKDAPVYALSALNNKGLEQLTQHITTGKTVVFLGSSGTGKSTIINRLLGADKQKTSPISAHDGRGRHTTTSKNLIMLPNGGIVIDTPGLKELQLLCSGVGIKNAFLDIESLSTECRYRTCTHTNEPGCAVLEALNKGEISEERLENYHKLKREIAHNLSRHEKQSKNKRSKTRKTISKLARQIKKSRSGSGDEYPSFL